MRLSSIKLAGFKSFVDPTYIEISKSLVGVVGPNGCGKSNIIDAMRWVLGESRATELRGESMQDVIFNGSSERKAGHRASVELIFDNEQGRIGGQWAQYTELSVKRVLTRDGTSSYYINNLPVRRRDVHDIFLGTGLGPRAYAIIGQGMISRIIESKPDELRIFFEEAAGVSKYKERRRETENRLKETRENLQRVDDIMQELARHLEKLEQQAQVARVFAQLQQQADQQQQLLWLLKKNESLQDQEKHQQAIAKIQVSREAQFAQLRQAENELVQLRMQYETFSDEAQQSQNALYALNVEVSRLEAQIQFAQESKQRLQVQLEQWQAQAIHWHAQHEQAQALHETLLEQQAIAQENQQRLEAQYDEQEQKTPNCEQAFAAVQAQVEQQQRNILQLEQAIQLKQAQQQHLTTQIQQHQQRQVRLNQERESFVLKEDASIKQLEQEIAHFHQQKTQLEQEMLKLENAQTDLLAQKAQQVRQVQVVTQRCQQLDAKRIALTQLQERVQTQENMQAWLTTQQLDHVSPLWQHVRVESGWEVAFEAVLRDRIFALPVDGLAAIERVMHTPPPAKCTLYRPLARAHTAQAALEFNTLLGYVHTKDLVVHAALSDWLHQVYAMKTLDEALSVVARLPIGALCVTVDGHIVSASGVQFYAQEDTQSGILAREQEIDQLKKEGRAQQLILQENQAVLQKTEQVFTQKQAEWTKQRQALADLMRHYHETEKSYVQKSQVQAHALERCTQIDQELQELNDWLEQAQIEQETSRSFCDEQTAILEESQAQFDEVLDVKRQQESFLQAHRQVLRELERQLQQAQYAEQHQAHQLSECESKMILAEQESTRVAESLKETEHALSEMNTQPATVDLHALLEKRQQQEACVREARAKLDEMNAQLKQVDAARMMAEREIAPLNEKINALQLKEQAARLTFEQYLAQLTQVQCDEAALQVMLTPDVKVNGLQTQLAQLQQQIHALGAVNMAALEELDQAQERKTFLDTQSHDLNEAIVTLEDAIRKIDQETRAMLQNTFDEVNYHFGLLFPRLFGGGAAKLAMLGEEILDAGVQIVAQPPGKKNSTIHLLSGGEKALTAIALVFAMFQLNPAPFCLLDEVDAPLDDANTGRFAQLVQEMADKTQFVFISHNKISMEVAQQLVGVTMQEEGVSRIVAVDMQSMNDYIETVDD